MKGKISNFTLIGLSLPGIADPSIPIAASRAGEIGVLDLQFVEPAAAKDALTRLIRYGRGELGLRLDAAAAHNLFSFSPDLMDPIGLFILAAEKINELDELVARLRRLSCKILLEATCVEHLAIADQLDCEGVIVKGQESGGRVGAETTFILLQRMARLTSRPLWVQGGIGLGTAAACAAVGAQGVVLDAQLLLCRESQAPAALKKIAVVSDGTDSVLLGAELGESYRLLNLDSRDITDGRDALIELRTTLGVLLESDMDPTERCKRWCAELQTRSGSGGDGNLLFVGQDLALAAGLAERFVTVGGVLQAVKGGIEQRISLAARQRALQPLSALARDNGTEFPVVQGPMTRVSDSAGFAVGIAQGGGLPFMALALLKAEAIDTMLRETAEALQGRPWGVGLLGFIDEQLRKQQLEMVLKHRPPFALIAGGRPDQAALLEQEGIPCYLHVPSPSLMRLYWRDGVRRFVLEGRECGGHVGPRTSFVLWELMVKEMLDLLPAQGIVDNCHVLFAGGINDDLSSTMIAVLAAPLVERGVRVGLLMGTAYLFTKEAVSSGAIVQGFQDEAIKCDTTVELEVGPGHANRCADNPFVGLFRTKSRSLLEQGCSLEERRKTLDDLTLGRLRIASKGIIRNPARDKNPGAPRFAEVPLQQQQQDGMYMIGQVAALRDRACSVRELHEQVCVEGARRLEALAGDRQGQTSQVKKEPPVDVAIVGLSCFLPGAEDVSEYWANIIAKQNAVGEIPPERWDWRLYFDENQDTQDKIYSRWGGFLKEVPFDPLEFGIPPSAMQSVEPAQLLTLVAVKKALQDAGYWDRDFDRAMTSVILGVSGGAGDLGQRYAFRSELPRQISGIQPADLPGLPEWSSDSFPGILLNVYAGRVSNRFDFGGANFTVDAACASSLASVYLGVRELVAGTSDMVVTGGVDTLQNPFSYLCFSKSRALSPTGRCKTFDRDADGIAISEGLAMLVLKRLKDAERDGDRIYSVIKGVGASSDGRDKTLTVPRPSGQRRALERAYVSAGFSPATVNLFEAHGTGTVVGDRSEVEALDRLLVDNGARPNSSALGSVKSMIGHTKGTAGAAGLMKAALSLYHRTLPPTLNVENPDPGLFRPDGALYVNSETRPWLCSDRHPRRAGVSAFGFGGTNFHIALEEYTDEFVPQRVAPIVSKRPQELFYWVGQSRAQLQEELGRLREGLEGAGDPDLAAVAAAVWQRTKQRLVQPADVPVRLLLVVSDLADLLARLTALQSEWIDDGIAVFTGEGEIEGDLAFLFSGQGSQYPGMLSELALYFSEIRDSLENADRVLTNAYGQPLSSFVYPPPAFSPKEKKGAATALASTNVTQPALGAVEAGLLALLRAFKIEPAMAAGHSYGEFVALYSAGVYDEDTLYRLSETRGRLILEQMRGNAGGGGMAAVPVAADALKDLLESIDDLYLANLNSPLQTVLSGSEAAIDTAVDELGKQGVSAIKLRVSCAFHSPLVAQAEYPFAEYLRQIDCCSPRFKVFSNSSGGPYPDDPEQLVQQMAEHLTRPVHFTDQIESMYSNGARIFVEVGPRDVLTKLNDQILAERTHLSLSVERPGEAGYPQFLRLLARLAASGTALDLDRLFEGRVQSVLDLDKLDRIYRPQPLSATTWLINSEGYRRPQDPKKTAYSPTPLGPLADRVSLPAPQEPAVQQKETVPTAAQTRLSNDDDLGRVFTEHQRLMNRFLEVQQQVMSVYLGAPENAGSQVMAGVDNLFPDFPPSNVNQPSVDSAPEVEPQEPSPASASGSNLVDIEAQLLEIVAERTGYPAETLGLDMDIEADLGIDSIKRVEILGEFRRSFGSEAEQQLQGHMDELAESKTLGRIVELTEGLKEADVEFASNQATAVETANSLPQDIPRYLLQTQDLPRMAVDSLMLEGKRILITDDEQGVARVFAERVRALGGQPLLVGSDDRDATGEQDYRVDMSNPQMLSDLLIKIHGEQGPLAGIVHLLPLRAVPDFGNLELQAWREIMRRQVKGLFYLVQAAAPDILQAKGWVMAATPMGGGFGVEAGENNFFPGHGGIAGFIKSLAKEWDSVHCVAVDLNPAEDAATLATYLLEEMAADDGVPESAYLDGSRRTLGRVPAELSAQEPALISIDSASVLLVVGGARGITAEITRQLAERYQPVLLLTGRSPLPPQEEDAQTAELRSAKEIKEELFRQLKVKDGVKVEPRQVEVGYRRLMAEREIRGNLQALRQTGAQVLYYQVDAREPQAMASLLDEVRRDFDRLDGVILAAGVIEDKLVVDKQPDSFDRVFDTKADSAFILSRILPANELKFLAFFTSVAGRFGNRGQADYATANEVLARLAHYLDGRWTGRVVAVDWGPWKSGMASPEVQEQLRAQGVQVIDPAFGRSLLDQELTYGKGCEVILGRVPDQW